jgi:tetratricopeptide (TPR) repeat protein
MNKTKCEVKYRKWEVKKFVLYFLVLIFYFSFLTLLFGCGFVPQPLSDVHMAAVELNQKAEAAFKRGNYQTALNLYNEALKNSRAVENIDGIAINLINKAAVYRKLGDKINTHKCADEILGVSYLTFSQIRLSEAAYIKALLYFDEGKYSTASEWTDKALALCKGCNTEGRIYNLKGRIVLINGDYTSAVSLANKGLALSKSSEDADETANSLRLLAEAKAMTGEYSEAIRLYEEALSTDKSSGQSRKIIMDLMGIGNVLCRQGKSEDAVKYFKRALSVSEAIDDKQSIKDVNIMIEKCSQTSGKR